MHIVTTKLNTKLVDRSRLIVSPRTILKLLQTYKPLRDLGIKIIPETIYNKIDLNYLYNTASYNFEFTTNINYILYYVCIYNLFEVYFKLLL